DSPAAAPPVTSRAESRTALSHELRGWHALSRRKRHPAPSNGRPAPGRPGADRGLFAPWHPPAPAPPQQEVQVTSRDRTERPANPPNHGCLSPPDGRPTIAAPVALPWPSPRGP